MSEDARAAILASIRQGLRETKKERQEKQEAPQALRTEAPADLCGNFLGELEALGAQGFVVSSAIEAAGVVTPILARNRTKAVCLGEGPWVASLRQALGRLDADGIAYLDPQGPPHEAAQAQAGIVEADAAIAQTGSILLDTRDGLLGSLLPPLLIAFVWRKKIFADIAGALEEIARAGKVGGRVTILTGPSRTADIEKKLVLGVHGPREVAVLVTETQAPGS